MNTRFLTTIIAACAVLLGPMLNRIAGETGVEEKSRRFSPTSHLAAMLFAQFSRAMGLNDVCY